MNMHMCTQHPFTHTHSHMHTLTHAHTHSESGGCITCGDNGCGQLGYQKERGDRRPAMVTALSRWKVDQVACGDFYTVAATNSMCTSLIPRLSCAMYGHLGMRLYAC